VKYIPSHYALSGNNNVMLSGKPMKGRIKYSFVAIHFLGESKSAIVITTLNLTYVFLGACMDHQISYRFIQGGQGLLIDANGNPEYEATVIPEICLNGVLGGICDRGIPMTGRTADILCSSALGVPPGFISEFCKNLKKM